MRASCCSIAGSLGMLDVRRFDDEVITLPGQYAPPRGRLHARRVGWAASPAAWRCIRSATAAHLRDEAALCARRRSRSRHRPRAGVVGHRRSARHELPHAGMRHAPAPAAGGRALPRARLRRDRAVPAEPPARHDYFERAAFDAREVAQEVLAEDAADLVVAVAALEQLLDQLRDVRDVGEVRSADRSMPSKSVPSPTRAGRQLQRVLEVVDVARQRRRGTRAPAWRAPPPAPRRRGTTSWR